MFNHTVSNANSGENPIFINEGEQGKEQLIYLSSQLMEPVSQLYITLVIDKHFTL